MQARLRALLPLLAYCAIAVVTTWPLALHPRALLGAPVGPGDPFLNVWILGWGLHALTTSPLSLIDGRVFDANIFHPASGTLAYSDHLLLQSLGLSPLYWASGDVVLCYNVLLLASLVASAYAMHLCVRRLVGSEGGAYLAGLAWGFGSYRFGHLIHVQLQSLYWLPMATICLHRLVASRRRRDALWLGVVLGLQALSSVYYAVIGGIGLGVAALVLLVMTSRRGRGRLLRQLVLAGAVAAALSLPVGMVYFRVQQEQGFGRSLFEAQQGAAYLGSYFRVPAGNLLYGRTGWLHQDGLTASDPRRAGPERELFPGFVLLSLAVAGTWRGWRGDARPLVGAAAAMLATGFVLSLGPDGVRPLYATLHQVVFGFQAIRAPARFAVLVQFALALLAALGWREMSRASHAASPRRPQWRPTALLVLACVEYAHVPTVLTAAPASQTAVGQWLRTAPGSGAVAVLPLGLDSDSTPAMVQSLEHFRPLINGYSGQRPDFYPAVVDAVRGFPSDDALVVLHDRGVQYVVTREPVTLEDQAPLVLRASLSGGAIYELVWTPDVEARLATRTEVAPPPPGPLPFSVGERAVYRVHWDGGLSLEAGTVTLSVTDGWRLEATAVTSPAVSRFFEANDTFVTVTDPMLTVQTHERDQHEGARHVTRAFIYDHAARAVRMGSDLRAAAAPGAATLPLVPHSRDALAVLFYLRALPLEPGTRYQIPVNEAGRNVRVDVVVAARDTIDVNGQAQPALRLEPVLRERVERRRPPQAQVWISDDARRVPLRVSVTAAFGRVQLDLAQYQAGR